MPRTINLHEDEIAGNADFAAPMELANRVRALIATPKARDKQIKIGPSGIGDPCDLCVGNIMSYMLPGARKPRPEKLRLGSWVGTAGHAQLERLINDLHWDGWESEKKLYCGTINGYGDIHGHTDGYDLNSATIVDWKFLGPNGFKKMKQNGVASKYLGQRNVYGRGIELAGLPIKYVMNFVVPLGIQMAGVNDILVDIDYYRPDIAQACFDRAQVIWDEYVTQGAINELSSDEDCFTCSGFGEF